MSNHTPTLYRVNSHSVQDSSHGTPLINKEQVYLYCTAEWRGTPCIVTMQADRSRTSNGKLTDWRIYAEEVREGEPGTYGSSRLSDTARQRLGAQCHPLVVKWLASDAYTASESMAYADMILRTIRELLPMAHATARVRHQLSAYAAKLPRPMARKLAASVTAYEAFVERFENAHATITKER